ncbi:unnamed protein product [Psylliodes chrysocephalus]|uniref:Uncharacterized protein n=1 Tax=Psylliodes chrysocephalus TaxID=3402493 RepID=A0A9P0D797_9CUCU|nr:unnamed protein product [Psylliodes chrysocephala]
MIVAQALRMIYILKKSQVRKIIRKNGKIHLVVMQVNLMTNSSESEFEAAGTVAIEDDYVIVVYFPELNKKRDENRICGALVLALREHDETEESKNKGVFRELIDLSSELEGTFQQSNSI